MKKCIKCGSTNLKLMGDTYYCKTCRSSFSVEVIDEHEALIESRIQEGLKNNKRIFDSKVGPVYSVDEMKEYISSLVEDLKCSMISDKKYYENSLKNIVDEYVNEATEDVKVKLHDMADDIQNQILEGIKEIYTKSSPKVVAKEGITTDEILSRANSLEDYGILAFLIRNNVEEQLLKVEGITTTTVSPSGKQVDKPFRVKSDVYLQLIDKYDMSYLIPKNSEIAELKELPVELRFRMYGLTENDARAARLYWKMCNNFIHESKECQKNAKDLYYNGSRIDGIKYDIHEYFESVINFFRKNNLYLRK